MHQPNSEKRRLQFLSAVLGVALATLLGALAWAGESRYLGFINARGVSTTNLTTAAPFAVPFGSKVTLECDAEVRLLTDSLTVSRDGGTDKGVRVPADMLFQTSVGPPKSTFDAGFALPVAVIAVIPTSAAADSDAGCDVWQRTGTE